MWPSLKRWLDGRERLVWIFGIALVVRLIYALPQAELVWINDMGAYLQLASNMMFGQGYVTALEPHFLSWRPPGYPFFLIVVFTIFGHSALALAFVQSVIGALTCVGIQRIGSVCAGEKVGSLAAALCIVDPELIHFTPMQLTETLFVALLVWVVWLSIRVFEGAGWRTVGLTGCVLGAAILVRPSILPVAPLIALFVGFGSVADAQGRARRVLVIALLAAVVVAPWTIRNYRIHGEFVPVATIGGVALYVGIPPSVEEIVSFGSNWPQWRFLEAGMHRLPNGYDLVPELMGKKRPPPDPPIDELEQSRRGREFFFEYVREDPVRYAKLVAMKASLVFNPLPKLYQRDAHEDYGLGRFDVLVRVCDLLFLTLLFAMLPLGMLTMGRVTGPRLLVAGVVLFYVALQLLFRPALRYFLPGLVLASVFTAAGLIALPKLGAECRARDRRALLTAGLWAGWLVAFTANAYYQLFVLHRVDMQGVGWELGRLFGA